MWIGRAAITPVAGRRLVVSCCGAPGQQATQDQKQAKAHVRLRWVGWARRRGTTWSGLTECLGVGVHPLLTSRLGETFTRRLAVGAPGAGFALRDGAHGRFGVDGERSGVPFRRGTGDEGQNTEGSDLECAHTGHWKARS